MDDKKVFAGFGALAAILLLVAFFMPRDRGPDTNDLIASEVAPISAAVTELGGRFDTVEGSLDEVSGQLANAVTSEDLAAVASQVAEALALGGVLSQEIAELRTELNERLEAMASPLAPAPTEAKAAATTPVRPAVDGPPGLNPGQTALFADGALRVFISRLDPHNKVAHVSALGEKKMLTLGQGRTMAVGADHCRVTLVGVSDNGALLDAICGDDLPAPEGLSAGNTMHFADGALRVFASHIQEDQARLSVNGEMHHLKIGRSAPTMAGDERCRVHLDALDRGHAVVSAKCGADVTVSDVAGPGSTLMLDDGATRVFVGAVMDGIVRFSVNGQTQLTGASGDRHSVGENCHVVVEDVVDGKASFSHLCEG
ncbi:MAG: hypothetical protein AAGF94_08440 [Pseudomonadota bacterium]